MASLEKPPIDIPVSEENGEMTSRWKNWVLKLFNRVGGTLGGNAPNNADFITQTPNSELSNEQALSLLSTGFVKVTTGSGVLTSTGNTLIQASDLANTTVTAASYTVNGAASYTVDAQGRLTSSSSPVITITGTADKITVSGGTGITPTITIASTYLGQTSITTLGTIATGTWQGTSISTTYTDAKKKTFTGTANRLTIAGTATDPTFDVSTNYVGQTTITTLGTITTGVWNGTVGVTTYGFTGLSSYTQGDILYYDTGTALSKLAKNTTATRYLSNTGTSNNPAWAQVALATGVSGTLPIANGGTGVTSVDSFSAYDSGGTTLAANGFTKINLATENWDTNSAFSGSTFTCKTAGKYLVSFSMGISSTNVVTTNVYVCIVYKNGAAWRYSDYGAEIANQFAANGSCLVSLAVNDTLELYGYNSNAVTTIATNASNLLTYMDAVWVGP